MPLVDHYTMRTNAEPSKPETAMASAFLTALLRWAERANRSGPIALPAGYIVDPAELLQVVTALKCAGRERQRRVA
jgi:hypothetical protein